MSIHITYDEKSKRRQTSPPILITIPDITTIDKNSSSKKDKSTMTTQQQQQQQPLVNTDQLIPDINWIDQLYKDMEDTGAKRCIEMKLSQDFYGIGSDGDKSYLEQFSKLNLKALIQIPTTIISPTEWKDDSKTGDKIFSMSLPLYTHDKGTKLDYPTMILIPGHSINAIITSVDPCIDKSTKKRGFSLSSSNFKDDDESNKSLIWRYLLANPAYSLSTNNIIAKGEIAACITKCKDPQSPAYIHNAMLPPAVLSFLPENLPGVEPNTLKAIKTRDRQTLLKKQIKINMQLKRQYEKSGVFDIKQDPLSIIHDEGSIAHKAGLIELKVWLRFYYKLEENDENQPKKSYLNHGLGRAISRISWRITKDAYNDLYGITTSSTS